MKPGSEEDRLLLLLLLSWYSSTRWFIWTPEARVAVGFTIGDCYMRVNGLIIGGGVMMESVGRRGRDEWGLGCWDSERMRVTLEPLLLALEASNCILLKLGVSVSLLTALFLNSNTVPCIGCMGICSDCLELLTSSFCLVSMTLFLTNCVDEFLGLLNDIIGVVFEPFDWLTSLVCRESSVTLT